MPMARRWARRRLRLRAVDLSGLTRRYGLHWRRLWLLLAVMVWTPPLSAQDATATPVPRGEIQLTGTAIAAIERVEHNVLRRPVEIADDRVHWIDRTYAYGSTQFDRRPVHLGVEFVNERNTPVFAAKRGRVVFAGDDSEVMLGPQLDYYGNVVVLAHDLFSLAGQRVFSLYGHLELVEVEAGQEVEDQARIGRVGSSGVAIGPHLHFEVRVGNPFDHRQTRNPELWLQHYVNHGMVVGSLRNQAGEPLLGRRLTLWSEQERRDVFSYGGDEVNSDPVWRENFTAGDLPEGEYEIVVSDETGLVLHQEVVQVEAYRATVVEITLEE